MAFLVLRLPDPPDLLSAIKLQRKAMPKPVYGKQKFCNFVFPVFLRELHDVDEVIQIHASPYYILFVIFTKLGSVQDVVADP